MVINISTGATIDSIKAYQGVKELFGNFLVADMTYNKKISQYTLVLKNKYEDKLIFTDGISSDYYGEGCRGTLKILKDAGFDVSEDFIKLHKNFKLLK